MDRKQMPHGHYITRGGAAGRERPRILSRAMAMGELRALTVMQPLCSAPRRRVEQLVPSSPTARLTACSATVDGIYQRKGAPAWPAM